MKPADCTPGSARTRFSASRQNTSLRSGRVANHVGIERDRGEAVAVEAHIGALRRAKAAQQQAGNHQQHRRERDLLTTSASRSAQRRPANLAGRRVAAQVGDEAWRRGLQRRQQARQQPGHRGDEQSRTSARAHRSADRTRRRPAAATGCPAAPAPAPTPGRRRQRRPACRAARLRRAVAGSSRPRLAPIARRTLISRRRAEARASSMPATFAQAISRTRPTTVISPAAPIDRTPPAWGTSMRTSSVGTAAIWRSLLVCTMRGGKLPPDQRDVGVRLRGGDAGLEPALDEHPSHAAPLEPRACRSATAPNR